MKTKLRDDFAIAAIPGLIQGGYLKDSVNPNPETSVETYRNFAKYAYKIADAMLLERKAKEPEPV